MAHLAIAKKPHSSASPLKMANLYIPWIFTPTVQLTCRKKLKCNRYTHQHPQVSVSQISIDGKRPACRTLSISWTELPPISKIILIFYVLHAHLYKLYFFNVVKAGDHQFR